MKTVATGILEGCFGCHMSLLDLHEEVLDVLGAVELVYSPIIDVKDFDRADIGILDGAVATEENEETARRFREKCDVLIALGTCSCYGGIPGMRNLFALDDVLNSVYGDSVPSSDEIPRPLPNVKSLDQVVRVDYYIPGCPPLPHQIQDALVTLLNGGQPVELTRGKCAQCTRTKKELYVQRRDFVTDGIKAVMELDEIDPKKCFLEQGIVCMGPVTREGCESKCPTHANMPCRGCWGPTPEAKEVGAKMVNSLASILPAGAMMFMEDIVGTGYRYSMAISEVPGRMGR